MKAKVAHPMKRFHSIVRMFGTNLMIHRGLIAVACTIIFLGLHAAPLWATDHTGNITSDTTWYAADNPHIIVGNVTVQTGVTLTIEDGVNVQFDSNKHIAVYGTLTAVGTPGTGILFTRSGASNGNGLYFYSGGGGTFDYCTMEYAAFGINTFPGADTISVSNSTIQNNGTGVNATGGTLIFINNEIINNTSYGIYLSGAVSPSFGSNLSQWNDIYSNGAGSDGRDLRNGTSNTYAQYVYWGTAIGPEIEAKIWDKNDDPGLGVVCYAPWSNASHDRGFASWLTIALESGAKSTSGDMRLIWTQPCDTDRYVVYRSTAADAIGDSLAGTTDTTYLDAGAAGDVNTNYFYTVTVIDTAGTKLGDSNQVGEFDTWLMGGGVK